MTIAQTPRPVPPTITYLTGDALETVRAMPDQSVDLSTCSPPFLALRDYNGVEGQWGSEANPAAFLDSLLELATETRRVLSPFGSLAWELGDTYSGSGGGGGDYLPGGLREGQVGFDGSAEAARAHNAEHWRQKAADKAAWPLAKSLTGVPTLFAWSLAYGRNLLNPDHTFQPWRIRNIIVWARSNPPVGALGDKYRPATSYITVATPSARRWFDLDAVRACADGIPRVTRVGAASAGRGISGGDSNNPDKLRLTHNPAGAPPLDHWTDTYDGDHTWLVNSRGSKLAHYAMWPAHLAERLVLSMCPAQVCTTCREPRRRIVEAERLHRGQPVRDVGGIGRSMVGKAPVHSVADVRGMNGQNTWTERTTTGWSDCGHRTFRRGHVLDPFAGTSTTLCVANIHGRDATGIDIDPANRELVPKRMAEVKHALLGVKDENVDGQMDLFGDVA